MTDAKHVHVIMWYKKKKEAWAANESECGERGRDIFRLGGEAGAESSVRG